jgi:hypothetical protein
MRQGSLAVKAKKWRGGFGNLRCKHHAARFVSDRDEKIFAVNAGNTRENKDDSA